MPALQKLTKKQKKGLAFRQKKGNVQPDDVPVAENQDLLELSETEQEKNTDESNDITHNDARLAEKSKAGDVEVKKRKRDDKDDTNSRKDPEGPKAKRKKKEKALGPKDGEGKEKDTETEENKSTKSRFILFVGNLKYTTSKEAVLGHFAACDPPPTVRLLTPKSGTTTKSKGCAFLEFSHRNALQQALKLHQSELEGRKINVELTAGGGGKGDKRLEKVRGRNRELATQRKKRTEKEHTASGVEQPTHVERPQRISKTSGVEEEPLKKRTWTVGDNNDEDGKTHRGGKKHGKSVNGRTRPSKIWGTGVNAIPVG